VIVRHLGVAPYEPTWRAMQEFTASRNAATADELWLVQHPPVYTLGQAGKPEHLLHATEIPLVKIDRGGQITYHGPGQVVAYLLLDLHRRHLKVREMVQLLEQALIDCIADYGLDARRKDGAPGVYIDGEKIAALGLRVKQRLQLPRIVPQRRYGLDTIYVDQPLRL
jgi:lipoyl(octanoyl) transferase